MTDKKTFDLLNFISENDNFSLKNGYDIAEEKFGWQIFLNSITELVNLSLITKKDDGLTYTLTKLGVIRQSELRTEFESLERDKKAERKKLHNESKLSDWQVRTFWPIFIFAFIGFGLGVYNFINSLMPLKETIKQEVRNRKTELELTKLRNLILTQKKDTLLTRRANSKKDK
jgi:hypothetical protein